MATSTTPAHEPKHGADQEALAAVVGHEPHNPVRDDTRLSPTEDLDRMPDGVPHRVIGMTAGFAVMFAALVGFMMLVGSMWTRVLVFVLVLIAVPIVVSSLRNKAARERDHVHPSR